MSLIARFFEGKGIPTVSIFLQEKMAQNVPAPRMIQVRWPFGHPYGEPDHPMQPKAMIKRCLDLLNEGDGPETLIQPDWPWRQWEPDLTNQWT